VSGSGLQRRLCLCLLWALLATLAPQAWAEPETLADDPVSSGRLLPFGRYQNPPVGRTATVLSDGSVLLYGSGWQVHTGASVAVQNQVLRERHQRAFPSFPYTDPKFWDAKAKGWRKQTRAPECDSPSRQLHTATALPDGRVLMAGGLCDLPRMADDDSPHHAHAALSIWDPATRQWQPAPSLAEARLFHTANLLPDGSVMIVGGEVDPALTDGAEPMVLSSVEQFTADRVTLLPALGTPRAKHTATVLADGGLLVVGGFDATGHAIANAERWQPATHTWQALPPARVARHSHTATLLPDGRVMVAGGIGADGQILSSIELWDPITKTWSDGHALPIPLYGHAATLVQGGKVLIAGGAWIVDSRPIPWAWTWNPVRDAWQVAGHLQPDSPVGLARDSSQITLAPRPDGGALVLTPNHIMRWVPTLAAPGTTPPLWHDRPTAAPLADGRVLWVGMQESETGASPYTARLWDPATRIWSDAGTLSQRIWMHANSLALPSGRVIQVGVDNDSTFHCEAWDQASQGWQDCGSNRLEKEVRGRMGLGTLSDGRAFAIANTDEVLVFDETRLAWTPARATWQTEDMAYGAPIRASHALLTLTDSATLRSFEVNHEAARFWQAQHGDLQKSSLLWDRKAGLWAYVLNGRQMGADAQWLPDGCAISTQPLAIFNPTTGKVTPLADPGLGIQPGEAEMVVLADGTVVVSGVPEGAKDRGAGFYMAKASCSGLTPRAEDEGYMADTLATDGPAPAVTPAASAGQAASAWAWRERVSQVWRDHRWLVLGCLFILPAVWLIRRRPRMGLAVTALVAGITYWQGHYGGALVVSTPCRMIGVWSSRHGSAMRRIELKEDGRYVMQPRAGGGDPPGGYTGRWAVVGHTMIWRHDQGHGDGPDINPMQADGDTRFTLTEVNGSKTHYELIRAVPSQRCMP
jgi:hypothetical protein